MTITWDAAVADWITALHAAGRSPRTVRLYVCHLRKVIRECPDGPASVTPTDLRYILACGRWKPETRKSVRGAFGAFFRWAHGTGIIETDPAQQLDTVPACPPGLRAPSPTTSCTRPSLRRTIATEPCSCSELSPACGAWRSRESTHATGTGPASTSPARAGRLGMYRSCAPTCVGCSAPRAVTFSLGRTVGTSPPGTSPSASLEHCPANGLDTPSVTGAGPPCTQAPTISSPSAPSSDTPAPRRPAGTSDSPKTHSSTLCVPPPNRERSKELPPAGEESSRRQLLIFARLTDELDQRRLAFVTHYHGGLGDRQTVHAQAWDSLSMRAARLVFGLRRVHGVHDT